ncbi:MAG TPA: hypothetical protein VEJ86_08015 [Candidatus Binataceae bacterium]|nr:hypothetical protein [Candidatus Binataceae bacterium]
MKPVLPITVAALLTVLLPRAAAAQIQMNITGGGQPSPIAISGLKNLGGDDELRVSDAFVDTLSRDLSLCGYFRIIDPHAYVEDPQQSGYDIGQFNFADWRSINAAFLVKGAVAVNGSQIKVTALLFDVAQQRRMMGKAYTGGPGDVAEMARRFADAILESTTGVRGPFDSKLAFVSTRGGRFKEIYTQTIDGDSLFRLTDNPTINIFPSFDKSARHLLYLSYKTFEPGLYLADLSQDTELRLRSPHGEIIGGALSPDGRRVAASVERDGITNLYLLDATGEELRQLTNTSGINVGPSFSADGSMLAFTSDRSGAPQIWVMDLSGGAPQRVTYSGDYNTTPAWSPDGKLLAYQSRSEGRFDIVVIPANGGEGRKVTDGVGTNESPSWSPDGRYLAFSSTRSGHPRIYLLMVQTGKILGALTEGKGNDTSPAWSWWLGE